jgi:hypothetical protein
MVSNPFKEKAMRPAFVALAGLICVAAVPALALETPKALGRAEGIYTPRAGDWEFSLTAPAFPVGALAPRGVGATINTCNGCGTDAVFGLGAGLGYAITDLVEVGGALGFNYVSYAGRNGVGGVSGTVLYAEPFLKVNFGSGMARDSRINPYALAAVAIGYDSGGLSRYDINGATATFTLELAGGAEFMLTHTWGLTLYVPFSVDIPTASGTSALINIGLGYGLVAYFD